MTDVTIYAAPLPEGPEASHRLLRRAAVLAAPQLTDCTLARQAQESPGFPPRRSCTSASRTAAGAGSARSRTRRSGSTCRRTGPAGRWRLRGGFSRRRRPNGCARAAKRRFLTSGARRRAGSNTPAAAFPPCRRRSSLRRTASFPPARTCGCSCCRSSTGIRCACVRRMPRGSRCENCKATPHNCVFALRRIFSVNPAV